jgi:hypothetical protein
MRRRRSARAALATAGVGVSALGSRAAWALCPNCLAQRPTLTPTLELVGLFLLLPFAVTAVVVWTVRRALQVRSAPASAPAAPPSPESAPASGVGGAQAG